MKCNEYAKLFKALSDETRVRVVQILTVEKRCACEILEEFNISQSTLSHHMKILCDSKIVDSYRNGKQTMYSVNLTKLEEVKDFFNSIGNLNLNCENC